jgi:medium-chain acyl-[acyl-carrier-protein] hydrolase
MINRAGSYEETNVSEPGEVPKVWSEPFKIRSYEVSTTNLASPASLCRYVQEAAGIHATELKVAGELLEENDLMWVLSRLRWQMKIMPDWHDDIRIDTWPTTRTSGIRAHRDFCIFDANGVQIGQASTIWLLLSRKSRRPVRIPNFLDHYQSPGLSEDLLGNNDLAELQEHQFSKEFEVRLSDLDPNQHVNNVCYVEWALDTLPVEFSKTHRVSDLDISFVGEGQYGDSVEARTLRQSDEVYCHQVSSKATTKKLALIRTKWVGL